MTSIFSTTKIRQKFKTHLTSEANCEKFCWSPHVAVISPKNLDIARYIEIVIIFIFCYFLVHIWYSTDQTVIIFLMKKSEKSQKRRWLVLH